MTKNQIKMSKIIFSLVPKIETVLGYDIKSYEKCILIKQHIEDWRNAK